MDDEAVPSGPDVEDNATLGKEEERHECGEAQCIGGTIMLDLNQDRDFLKAVEIVESNIMESAISAHEAITEGRSDDAGILFESVAKQILEVNESVLRAVLLEIADAAAGMVMHIAVLEGKDVRQPGLDVPQADPSAEDTLDKIDTSLADSSGGIYRESPARRGEAGS